MTTYGVTKERRMQLGGEATAGTAVAATALFRGPANSILDNRPVEHPDENVGYNVDMGRVYTPNIGAEYDMPDCPVTFEQGPYIPNASIHSLMTGVADGGTSTAKIYAFPFSTKQADHTFKTFTVEAGNNNLAHEMEYAFIDKWGISGAPKQALMWKGVHWIGRQRTSTTFTGSLTPPSVEEVLFQKGKIYLNDSGATIGTTQKTGTWLGFDFNVASGLVPVWTGDGNLYFIFVKPTGIKASGTLTVEDDATASGLETDWVANTRKMMRLEFAGSATGGTGGTYSTKLLRLDMALTIDKIDILQSVNGNDTKKINFTAVNSLTDSLFVNLTFVNLLATIP